jgi:tetratricopeptide (TPR) repeat protein/tRNA A-37 threonylcarbamoyl transferase component Bud32
MELIGRQFGHIRVTDVVGEGGMGAVYAGHDEKLDRKVALKVLHADQRLDVEARERLLREARALSKVDHPNICRIHDYIETGDVDLLVLEYIDGRTLQSAIEEGLPYSEKLRIAATGAEVLVRAHRAGIVHRDLKPENVMLTKTGEVKVLDFGLARWLHRGRRQSGEMAAEDSGPKMVIKAQETDPRSGETMVLPAARPSEIYPSGRREFLATAVGITLGTPLYMSPEQARGESLTPASDMFSYGLLLQVMFTGKEPHPDLISAREVILRVARGETNPVEGAPKPVTALINSLKQFAPADRPTAVQTVERLRFLIETPQRIARRTAAGAVATIMLFGGWRYTVDLDHERSIAVTERAEAQKQKAKAEDLINFIVGDLREKLEPVGRLDVLDAAAEKALQYVQALKPESMSVDELARNAKVLNQIGEVRVGQGKTPEALKLFSTSLGLATAAVERDPKDGDALLALGASQYWIGNAQHTLGKNEDALHYMREYQRTADRLAALDPNNREYRLEQAYGHGNVATMLEQLGRREEALGHHRASLAIKEEVAHRAPGDVDAQVALAVAHNKVGVALYRLGELQPSIEQFQKASNIYRELLKGDPKHAGWKQSLAMNMSYQGLVVDYLGDAPRALGVFRDTLAIQEELARLDPQNVLWQRAVAVQLRAIAAATAKTGDRETALRLYREARAKIAAVQKAAPTRAVFVSDGASIDGEYGRLLAESGDRAGGTQVLRAALARLDALPSPERSARYHMGRISAFLGDMAAPAATEAHFARAERELEPLIATSNDPSELAVWTKVLLRRNRIADARAAHERIRKTGYSSAELTRLCAEKGC